MSRLLWTTPGTRFFETGVDRGVLYIGDAEGVPWIGLISVEENSSGGDAKPFYIDGIKYLNLSADEEFEASINAYTYPVEFSACDGTEQARPGLFFGQQKRKNFSFSYRTKIGNDTAGVNYAYKIHLVYDALATPSSRSLTTIGENAEASDFTWSLTTKSRVAAGFKRTAHVVIDSRYTPDYTLSAVEEILYGTDDAVARIPTAEELIDIFDTPLNFNVVDIGGGKFTVSGPSTTVYSIGLDEYVIDHSSVTTVDADSATITY